MFRNGNPLRIAIVGTNNDKSYSGGRYLTLIMAYALAAEGQEVHIVTNKKPLFLGDLDPIAPGRVAFSYTADFREGLPDGPFDYVVVVPTGIFLPEFYENAIEFARKATARIALLNFESANWFNSIAPAPKDPRLWDYWRRSVVGGGLVLSIAHAAQPFAKKFYTAPDAYLRFEVMHPPINTPAADAIGPTERDDAIICFVRSTDAHKGGADLLSLDPSLFAARTLRIVSGGDMDPSFRRAIEARLGSIMGAKLEVHTAISDVQKFALIARSKALLFPSRFEGFGYPPVEAAWMGTEIACYDIPVLRETVGDIAHMASPFSVEALGEALATALAAPARHTALRKQVASRFGITSAGAYLHEILARSLDAVQPLQGAAPRAIWAPWREELPRVPSAKTVDSWTAPVPPYIVTASQTAVGDILVELRVACNKPINFAFVEHPNFGIVDPHIRPIRVLGDATLYGVAFLAPQEMLGKKFRLQLRQRGFKHAFDVELQIDAPTSIEKSKFMLRTLSPLPMSKLQLKGEIITDPPPDEIALTTDGRFWMTAPCAEGEFDLTAKVPDPTAGITVYAYRRGRVVGVFGGFPIAGDRRRNTRITAPRVATPKIVTPINLTDTDWHKGILRKPVMPHLGIAAVETTTQVGLAVGDALLSSSTGRLHTIRKITTKGKISNLAFDDAISPDIDGYPNSFVIIDADEIEGTLLRLEHRTEGEWLNGIWHADGAYRGRMICIAKGQSPERLPHSVLAFPRSGLRSVVAVLPGIDMDILLLDSPVLPVSDTQAPIRIHAAATCPDDRPLRIVDRSGDGWRKGILEEGPMALRYVMFDAQDGQLEGLVAGRELVFSGSGLRKVLSVGAPEGGTVVALLDRALSPNSDGAPSLAVRPQARMLAGNRQSTPLYPSPMVPNRPKWPQSVVDLQYRIRVGADTDLSIELLNDRPRVLFLTVVPPLPADQGNRVVTKNFVEHLIAQGFDVDIVLVGDIDPAISVAAFGDRVRIFPWPFPNWKAPHSAEIRLKLLAALQNEPFTASEHFVRDALRTGANWYHPFYIVPDQSVAVARRLYARHSYHSIVCNYAHSIRIAKELEDIRPLPPVAIVTHDALSRLPLEKDGVVFDTSYRNCPPEIERAVLDAIPGATVLAISQSEVQYFKEIGVRNEIVLCEYAGFGEFASCRTPETAFDATTFVFQGSGNPMNVAALNWFADNCWGTILRHLPKAQLIVSGRVSTQWKPNLPNLSLLGILPRAELLGLAERTTVAINPTIAGTGLKIKTVEAACAGTPSVFLPAAVDGIEDIASSIGRLAATPDEFVRHCVDLASNRRHWSALRATALRVAGARFSTHAVYGLADSAMRWDCEVASRRNATRAPYQLGLPTAFDPQEGKAVSLAVQLIEFGELAAAARLLQPVAASPLTTAGKYSILLGRAALERGDIAMSLQHAAEKIAAEPWELSGYGLMIEALILIGRPTEARETLVLATLACPSSPDLSLLAQRVSDKHVSPR